MDAQRVPRRDDAKVRHTVASDCWAPGAYKPSVGVPDLCQNDSCYHRKSTSFVGHKEVASVASDCYG